MRFAWALIVAFLALPLVARAQDTPPEGSSDGSAAHFDAETARRARAEFEAGIEHYRAGRFREAIHSFQVAASLTPSADISYNIARAYEELARREGTPADYDEAISYYRRYLSDRVDPPDRADVEAHIAELEERATAARAALVSAPTSGVLVIRCDHDGAIVSIDDEPIGDTPIDSDIELEAGRHHVSARLEGYIPFEADVTIEPGVRTGSSIELAPSTHHRSIQGQPVFAWVAFGLAGASLVASVVVGGIAASDQSAALSPFDMARLEDARGLAGWSDAALGAALGLATVGIVLYFAESASVGTETTRGGASPGLETEEEEGLLIDAEPAGEDDLRDVPVGGADGAASEP